jgi:hypothetical protein
MTPTDKANLTSLIRKAARRGGDHEWVARASAERYYGLVTCGPYMASVRVLVAEVL